MITEDYVSFETAKLLKEKGFDAHLHVYYSNEGLVQWMTGKKWMQNKDLISTACIRPTIQMAVKWLREEKEIAIIPIISSILDNKKFLWDVKIVVAKTNETYSQGWIYEEPERACEAALKYSLENLV